MRKSLWISVLFAVLSQSSLAQESRLKADNNAAKSIEKLEIDTAKLLIAGKWDEYAASLSEDFVRTTANGTLEHKQQAWSEFRTGTNRLLDMIPEELNVTTYGDTAVATSHLTILGRRNGKVTTTFLQCTDVLVQRDGHWFVIASQATPVAK